MAEQTIDVVVEGGKANAAPPLGPALGPLGVNIQEVVDAINDKTRDLGGIKVPVKVIINPATKNFKLEVGKPPASALILKELNLEKGSSTAGQDRVGDLTEEQVKKIARAKFGSDDEVHTNQIKGTCRSMGITVGEGKVTEEEKKLAEQHKKEAEEAAEGEEKKDADETAAAEGDKEEEAVDDKEAPAEEKEEEKK